MWKPAFAPRPHSSGSSSLAGAERLRVDAAVVAREERHAPRRRAATIGRVLVGVRRGVVARRSLSVVGHAGRGAFRNRHVSPEKYGPTTLNRVGPRPSSGAGSGSAQISSSPKASRVGTPAAVARVGSGAIHWLYQDWIPGQ